MVTLELEEHEFALLIRRLAGEIGTYATSGALSVPSVVSSLRDEASRLAVLAGQYLEIVNGPR